MGKSRLIPTALVLALIGGIGWAAVYAYDKGLTKRWRDLIMDELARRGIEAEIEKLTFDPFEGLVARKVSIYEDVEHRNVLATINNLTLDIDLARLVRKEQFLNTIDLHDADISFPIDPTKPEGERIQINNFSARIQMPDETIDIQKAEFEIGGLIVGLRGSLHQPSNSQSQPPDAPPDTRQQRRFIKQLINEIEKFHVAVGHPRLEVEIFGDLDHPSEIEARLQLRATEITRQQYYCDRLEADIEIKFPNIILDRLLIADKFGELHGHAEHAIGGDRVSFDVESSIDSHTLLRSILDTSGFGEIMFRDPPRLQVEGEYFFKEQPTPTRPPVRLFGNATCGKFETRNEEFEGFHVDFSIDREKLFFRNLLLEHKTGTAEAKILFNGEEGMRYEAAVNLSPKIFSLFIDNPAAKKMIARFDFDKSPDSPLRIPHFSLSMEGSGPTRSRTTWETTGHVTAGSFRYNRIPVENIFTDFELADNILTFSEFRLDREEGHLTGDIARIDSNSDVVTIRGVKGTIDPVPTTAYFSPRLSEKLKRYRFAKPPSVTLDGRITTGGPDRDEFSVTFKSPGAASYTFLKKSLPLRAPVGTVKVVGDKLDLDLKCKLFDGDVRVTGDFDLTPGEYGFTSIVSVDRVDFGQLAKTYEMKTASQGQFNGEATLTGQTDSLESIHASGFAKIYEGNVFAFPVLGPLSKLINFMMPKQPQLGYSIAREASAELSLDDGKLRAEDFQASAGGFELTGDGTVDLIADDIDFNIQMNLRGAPGVVLHPVSRLFKYKGEGPVGNPRWRPVNFTLPRGDGPGILGGPGILPRNRGGDANQTASGGDKKTGILENGIPIVRPLRKSITKGVAKGGAALKATGEKILTTGEKILGVNDAQEAPTPAPETKKSARQSDGVRGEPPPGGPLPDTNPSPSPPMNRAARFKSPNN